MGLGAEPPVVKLKAFSLLGDSLIRQICRLLQNFNMCKNFKIWNIQIQELFKDFQGPGIVFLKFKDFSRTS